MSNQSKPHKQLSNRAFGLAFAAVFCVITGIGWFVFHNRLYWTVGVALGFLTLAIICPGILLPLNRLWMRLTLRLGKFNNKVLLGLFFFLIILPMGLVRRMLGMDPMRRKPKKNIDSFWGSVYRQASQENLPDQF